MRKSLRVVVSVFVFVVVLAGQRSAHASLQTGDRVKLTNGVGNGPGGEFGVEFVSGLGGGLDPFQDVVFCLEKSENISYNTAYWVTIEPNALQGGGGSLNPVTLPYDTSTFNPAIHGDPVGGDGPVSGDNWGDATQWLFQYFALGQLDNAVGSYAAGDASSADALQNVIWYLQEEISSLYSGLTGSELGIADDLLDWALDQGDYTGEDPNDPSARYDVLAMNLWGTRTSTGKYKDRKQSQLLLIKLESNEPDDVVPEPMSVGIWGAFLALGTIVYRRRARAA